MVRSFIVLLLLAVFFLAGTLYGMDRGDVAAKDEKIASVEVPNNNEQAETIKKAEETNTIKIQETGHFTEKAASFLEAAVTGFYEVVVQILYQVSQLFF